MGYADADDGRGRRGSELQRRRRRREGRLWLHLHRHTAPALLGEGVLRFVEALSYWVICVVVFGWRRRVERGVVILLL